MTVYIDGANPVQFIPRSSERTFISIDATGSDETDAEIVSINTLHTLVSVYSDSTAKGVRLADTAEIGDSVQFIRPLGGSDYFIYDQNGNVLSATGSGAQVFNFTPAGWI